MLCGLLLLGSCATPTPTVGINHASFCEAAKVIRYSRKHDTDETIEAVKEHNAVGADLCGWPK